MKNIHILPIDKPSKLHLCGYWKDFHFTSYMSNYKQNQNIYITNDEEIKDGEYGICLNLVREGFKSHQAVFKMDAEQRQAMERLGGQKKAEVLKVILTTDQDLIKDGVQAIDDEFLEWFVKNPSCEKIEIVYTYIAIKISKPSPKIYKIIIPKEEPKIISDWLEQNRNPEIDKQVEKEAEQLSKQETLEETAKRYSKNKLSKLGFIEGAKWQAERMYNEEEVIDLIQSLSMNEDFNGYGSVSKETAKYFLEQFKKNRL